MFGDKCFQQEKFRSKRLRCYQAPEHSNCLANALITHGNRIHRDEAKRGSDDSLDLRLVADRFASAGYVLHFMF